MKANLIDKVEDVADTVPTLPEFDPITDSVILETKTVQTLKTSDLINQYNAAKLALKSAQETIDRLQPAIDALPVHRRGGIA
jgi:hypothetical protein